MGTNFLFSRKSHSALISSQSDSTMFRSLAKKDDNLIEFSSDSSSDEEGTFQKYSEQPVKRMAIIDTCNVLHAAGNAIRDAIGILIITKHLLEIGFDVRMFLPFSYMNKNKVANFYILEQLHSLGLLTIIDDGSHDDLVILEMAKNVGGFVVSNDKFRDHTHRISETQKPLINEVRGKCSLGLILTLTPNKKAMLVENDDPSFAMAFAQRTLRVESESKKARLVLGVLADYFQQKNCAANSVYPPTLSYYDPQDENLPEDFNEFYDLWYHAQENASR
uniref:RNase NYN domain-containing protein n=1 Tax=Ditylenchus dipsaci TaxID=166011 RepID=A0A915D4J3_9BILA